MSRFKLEDGLELNPSSFVYEDVPFEFPSSNNSTDIPEIIRSSGSTPSSGSSGSTPSSDNQDIFKNPEKFFLKAHEKFFKACKKYEKKNPLNILIIKLNEEKEKSLLNEDENQSPGRQSPGRQSPGEITAARNSNRNGRDTKKMVNWVPNNSYVPDGRMDSYVPKGSDVREVFDVRAVSNVREVPKVPIGDNNRNSSYGKTPPKKTKTFGEKIKKGFKNLFKKDIDKKIKILKTYIKKLFVIYYICLKEKSIKLFSRIIYNFFYYFMSINLDIMKWLKENYKSDNTEIFDIIKIKNILENLQNITDKKDIKDIKDSENNVHYINNNFNKNIIKNKINEQNNVIKIIIEHILLMTNNGNRIHPKGGTTIYDNETNRYKQLIYNLKFKIFGIEEEKDIKENDGKLKKDPEIETYNRIINKFILKDYDSFITFIYYTHMYFLQIYNISIQIGKITNINYNETESYNIFSKIHQDFQYYINNLNDSNILNKQP
jgi:hypothetical protein